MSDNETAPQDNTGWHPDPLGRYQYRYWEGTEWSGHVSTAGVSAWDPLELTPVANKPASIAPQPLQGLTRAEVRHGFKFGLKLWAFVTIAIFIISAIFVASLMTSELKTFNKSLESSSSNPVTESADGKALEPGADLSRTDLSYENLAKLDLNGADLTGSDLTGANLTGTNLNYATLTGADLSTSNLTKANLSHAAATGADLTGSNLTGANLTETDLTGADLYGTTLTGADLTGATIAGADLSSIVWDSTTKWPEGFTPPRSELAESVFASR